MSSNTTTQAAPITTISKFRALFLVLAASKGWTYTQLTTQVDQYRKGDEAITISWGATQMKEFLHTKGDKVAHQAQGGVGQKLQKLQHQAFRVKQGDKALSDFNWTWPKLTPKKVTELEALATKTFKIKEA